MLPLVQTSRNNDLKAISGETLSQLMDGTFDHVVASFEIVDCRCVVAQWRRKTVTGRGRMGRGC